jgi:hypothetical protein
LRRHPDRAEVKLCQHATGLRIFYPGWAAQWEKLFSRRMEEISGYRPGLRAAARQAKTDTDGHA